ncbi:hypothetical protein HXY32_04895 [Candidatus Bathyarchaeota archaeon]|nr:hypothetical protein [Candidatus Bathyarchaeota archaeon]
MSLDKNRIVIIFIVAVLAVLLIFSSLLFARGVSFWSSWRRSLTMDQAAKLAEDYLKSLNFADLAIDEIMEFEYNFYIVYYEKSTNIGAFEAIINKGGNRIGGMMQMMMGYGGVRPEQGPNMMWNTKYGMHGGMGWMHRSGAVYANNASVTEEQAKGYAQKYLDKYFSGIIAEDVHPFYGYYTIHIMKENTIFGMLSVNSATGEVWYHNWHGAYIQTLEF